MSKNCDTASEMTLLQRCEALFVGGVVVPLITLVLIGLVYGLLPFTLSIHLAMFKWLAGCGILIGLLFPRTTLTCGGPIVWGFLSFFALPR